MALLNKALAELEEIYKQVIIYHRVNLFLALLSNFVSNTNGYKMKITIFTVLRILLGLFMLIIGLNKFLVFTPIPSPSGDGGVLMQIYITSGFLKLIGLLEMLAGLALLFNRFVPLALIFITAIMFNATVFHALHDLSGIGPAAFCLLLSLVLVYVNREDFSVLLRA